MAVLYTAYIHTQQSPDAHCPGKGVTSADVILQLRQTLKAVSAARQQVLPKKGCLGRASPYLPQSYKVDTFILPILHIRKLR